MDLEALPAALEAVVTFPPHPPRCAQHLLLEEKAAHGPTVPAGRRHKKYRPPKRTIGFSGGGRWISPDGDKLRLHLPCKEKYRPPKRVIGIFGGGRWISPDGDKLRLHLPCKEKYQSPQKGNWYFWWGKMDSNHRRHCQQIYSLSPLATREFPHMQFIRRWSW